MKDMDQDVQDLAASLWGASQETETETETEETTDGTEEDELSTEGENSHDNDAEEEGTEQEQQQEEEVTVPTDKKGNAFAQMRVENKQLKQELAEMKAVLNRLADAQGVDQTALLNKLGDEADETQAKRQGIDPEMYKRIRQLEESEQARTREASQERFSRRLVEFNQEARLGDAELRQFFADAGEAGFDLINTPTNFMTIYRGLYHDKLMKQQEEAARQAELAKRKKAQQSTATIPQRKGSAESTVKSGDINSILNDLSKSFKM